ncbi:hypothetical protein PoB_001326400 [Plakobranchus ocellatus]|uniref:Uncharacterized protein n=1 Tax=Plakobranchus ocellatus TaxID=259542 RepID=A0AAV3YUK9_9GAST|nr:hypothetical protein PoB_001326400 [Plakobranchus ocellatus]
MVDQNVVENDMGQCWNRMAWKMIWGNDGTEWRGKRFGATVDQNVLENDMGQCWNRMAWKKIWANAGTECPQQGDLRLSGPPSGQGAGSGARTRDRRVPADLRADSQATVLPTPPHSQYKQYSS